MAGDLFELLVEFQPDSPDLKHKRDYDQQARKFVSELNNVSASQWQKGADTPQDLLTVCDAIYFSTNITDTASY